MDEKRTIDSFPQFFVEARLNFAENVFSGQRNGISLIAFSEILNATAAERVSWSELRLRVKATADALHGSGLRMGDVITCKSFKHFLLELS